MLGGGGHRGWVVLFGGKFSSRLAVTIGLTRSRIAIERVIANVESLRTLLVYEKFRQEPSKTLAVFLE